MIGLFFIGIIVSVAFMWLILWVMGKEGEKLDNGSFHKLTKKARALHCFLLYFWGVGAGLSMQKKVLCWDHFYLSWYFPL